MQTDPLQQLAQNFRDLGQRFEDCAVLAVEPKHLASDLAAHGVQAGRLLVEAIDAGAWPQWDHRTGRLPGASAIVGCTWSPDTGLDTPTYRLTGELTPDQCAAVWTFAVGSWLVREHPSRFRHGAEQLDWDRYRTAGGRLVDAKGEPITARWYCGDTPLADDWKPHKGMEPGEYELRRSSPPVRVSATWDETDALHRHRARAAAYADACKLVADLLAQPPCTHNEHFTSVVWYGRSFTFKDMQAEAVRVLWEAWEQGQAVGQQDIKKKIDSQASSFRLIDLFRRKAKAGKGRKRKAATGHVMHPAWDVMIRRVGPGTFALVRPD